MRQVHEHLAHGLVEHNRVRLLEKLAHNLAFVVLDDQHFFWLDHALNHHQTQIGEDLDVEGFAAHGRALHGLSATEVQAPYRARIAHGELLVLFVQLTHELGPVFEADLEHLTLGDLRHLDQVQVCIEQHFLVLGVLEQADVRDQKVAEEQGEVEDQFLVLVRRRLVHAGNVRRRRDHAVDGCHDHVEENDKLGVVLGTDIQVDDLREALERDVTKIGYLEEARDEAVDDVRFKNKAQGDPVEEAEHGLEGRLDQRWLVGLFEHFGAQLEHLAEFATELVLEVARLGLGHLFGGEVKHFFGQEAQDGHVVFADREGAARRRHDLGDKVGPVVGPLLLEDLDECRVELAEQGALAAQVGLFRRHDHDQLDDKVADALLLVDRQHLPARGDELI